MVLAYENLVFNFIPRMRPFCESSRQPQHASSGTPAPLTPERFGYHLEGASFRMDVERALGVVVEGWGVADVPLC